MTSQEVRHRLVSALLQADGPRDAAELAAACGLDAAQATAGCRNLVAEGLAAVGRWRSPQPGTQYRWAARWHEELQRRTAQVARALRESVVAAGPMAADVFGEPARSFSQFVVEQYHPPEDKRFLVVLQCSVGRPFSSSPSQAFMRRAISCATGCDPAHDFARCPVHVVVLASEVGPVPYELERVPPADIPARGVKQFDEARYARALPVLADRMAAYLRAHRDCYDRAATFTHGRYGEVIAEAQSRAGWRFPILPAGRAPLVVRIEDSVPRTYWQRYWIQLYHELVSWLPPADQARAAARLKAAGVVWR